MGSFGADGMPSGAACGFADLQAAAAAGWYKLPRIPQRAACPTTQPLAEVDARCSRTSAGLTSELEKAAKKDGLVRQPHCTHPFTVSKEPEWTGEPERRAGV
jgi:hypothetical protein